ncbi:MAG TPA: phosphate ABC transporter ATP-binding protein PstB [Acidimicrobiales bacterium]|nr:phosphate ABC transporter ATP-binding protein PstB [Acidimicrobiales bacterium]
MIDSSAQVGSRPGVRSDKTLAPEVPVRPESDRSPRDRTADPVFRVKELSFYYGAHQALRDVSIDIGGNEITAFIGPSGCGKTTFIRCLNRMNDLIPGTRLEGEIDFEGRPLYGSDVRAIDIRRRIGMVFQKPNPFPKSIYDNVALTPRRNGVKKSQLDQLVEESLRRASLWDEVKDKLAQSAFSLSGGQQQRLCIARAIAVRPDVILMDEPCSALDPVATFRIEELMAELKSDYTIVIVTHNMQQAARVSDKTAFFTVDVSDQGRVGVLVEIGETSSIFTSPEDQRTEDYITGRFG